MKSGVYAILNTVAKKAYVGSSVNARERLYSHKSKLRMGTHCNKYLQASWDKHGESAFVFDIIEFVAIEDLIYREQFWIDELDTVNRDHGYNLREIADSNLGYKHSEGAKSRLGRIPSDETRAKLVVANTGRKHTDEMKAKVSRANKGKIMSVESRAKMSASRTGMKRSAEFKARMSILMRGKHNGLGVPKKRKNKT